MRLLRWETLSTEETLARFKKTRLKGFDRPYVYENATLELAPSVDPETLAPTQRYLLKNEFNTVLTLEQLFRPHGIDVFALTGAVLFWIERDGEEEGPIPLTPPIVEESVEPDGRTVWIINDGMHRIAAARKRGRTINVIRARGVPRDYPYYAFPMAEGWNGMTELDELPDGFQKKAYRVPENYKALFRDFNEVFPGVQKQRKETNPSSLTA